MSKQAFETLLKDFGASLDIPDLALDEDDYVAIVTDQELLINLDYDEESDSLIFYTTIGAVPRETRVLVHEELLQANFHWQETGGASLCLDPEGEHALLMFVTSADGLDLGKMESLIIHMSGLTARWVERFDDYIQLLEIPTGQTREADVPVQPTGFA